MTQYRAMVFVPHHLKKPAHWKALGIWRMTKDEAKKDADNHRLNTNPVAKIQIYTLKTEVYDG